MTVATASRTSGPASPWRRARAAVALVAASLVLTACGGDDTDADEAKESASPSASATESGSPSPTASPTPKPPSEPRFGPGREGKRVFVKYIVDGWSYGLTTNDPSVLLDASGKKPCRGCVPFRDELKQREKEGWSVRFPGAKLRKVTFRPDGEIEVATAVVDIPPSQSIYDDGTLRNENKAHRGARFLIDLREEGKAKKRQWTLAAFSIK